MLLITIKNVIRDVRPITPYSNKALVSTYDKSSTGNHHSKVDKLISSHLFGVYKKQSQQTLVPVSRHQTIVQPHLQGIIHASDPSFSRAILEFGDVPHILAAGDKLPKDGLEVIAIHSNEVSVRLGGRRLTLRYPQKSANANARFHVLAFARNVTHSVRPWIVVPMKGTAQTRLQLLRKRALERNGQYHDQQVRNNQKK